MCTHARNEYCLITDLLDVYFLNDFNITNTLDYVNYNSNNIKVLHCFHILI